MWEIGNIKSKNIFNIIKDNKNIFIETGTNKGLGVLWSLDFFDKIFSIEILDKFYLKCSELLKDYDNVKLIKGDSSIMIGNVLNDINESCFIFLDAHGVKNNDYYLNFYGNNPIKKELDAIKNHHLNNHVIVIDDERNLKDIKKDLIKLLYKINNNYQIFTYKDMIIAALSSDLNQNCVESINNIISKCKNKYGNRFKYYITGSYARNEIDFNDYDIAIYDNENDNKDWESLLKLFYNKNEKDAKYIDAQISQYIPEVIKMSGKELYKNRNRIVKRFVYSDEKLKSYSGCKYNNINNNLWQKEVCLVPEKHKLNGLDKIKRIYIEI